ncbi:hypothetical protein K470DRAFT_258774 [Piedraia hortae CBS 480.64]|uniref:Uncharacterized protein n=1 Tax=Piedraia hortae CBS 480.64 TaxID=1314780 RepID=A0A6A7BW59_9PEZI|nr:hypothetical protein K470DRAFT_258774 [Piedraia hortae CBS 480.64]
MSCHLPTRENNWLGFCPCAVKLQNGDKKGALKRRTEFQDSYSASGLTTYRCAEKGCAFQGHSSIDYVWKASVRFDQRGLQCRWAFLAKSHVKQAAVQRRQYQFQCPICILQYGHAEGRVWCGPDLFFDHVSTHRGKDVPPEVLQKLNIVADRICEESENYDLNFFPMNQDRPGSNSAASASDLSLARVPTHTSVVDKLRARKPTMDANTPVPRPGPGPHMPSFPAYGRERSDSVMEFPARQTEIPKPEVVDNAEPWSVGLSEWHVEKESAYFSPDF